MMRMDHYNPLLYYWLYDRKTGKVLRVRPKIDEVKTTTRNENDLLNEKFIKTEICCAFMPLILFLSLPLLQHQCLNIVS